MAMMLLILLVSVFFAVATSDSERDEFLYGKFPDDFVFGASTSAYQIEGGWNADGKGPSIYDEMVHTLPYLFKNQTGDIADDSYHKYKEDVRILKDYGAKAYRFSIAWSRVLPNGTTDVINQAGIDYYNKLLDELIENNIEPIVTLYHWDLPLAFRPIGGWLNRSMIGYFNDYAKVCFKNFGTKVKKWLTLNEPLVVMERHAFYMKGFIKNKTELSILQYQTMHHLILGHATAYQTYVNEFKGKQKGEVSIAISSTWGEPKTQNKQDLDAAERYMQFTLGIFAHPIFLNGDYPEIVKDIVANKSKAVGIPNRLPKFTEEEKKIVKGSADYFGLNNYESVLVENHVYPVGDSSTQEYRRDGNYKTSYDDSWEIAGAYNFRVVPWGMRRLLAYIKKNYKNPVVYITENGCMVPGEYEMSLIWRINDVFRINFYRRYINEVLKAIVKDGVNVKGYMAWTLMDNFEWQQGYHATFGLHYVNFSDPQRTRVPKRSVSFFKGLIKNGGFLSSTAMGLHAFSWPLILGVLFGALFFFN